MAYKKKTWQEKIADRKDLPKVLELEKRFPCYNAVHKMGAEIGDEIVLTNPSEVIDLMKRVPAGRLTTIVEICKTLAKRHGVKGCCSLTTGIFIMTAAHADEEAHNEEKNLDIPYWRTLKADGSLNDKFPGGAESHKRHLEDEGFKVFRKGKKLFVKDFQSRVIHDFKFDR